MVRNRNRRNYGYGRQFGYAINNALVDRYGDMAFATQAAHRSRLRCFAAFLKEQQINDLRWVTSATLEDYGLELQSRVEREELAPKTAKNRLSSANVLMTAVRGDAHCSALPRKYIGRLSSVRIQQPRSLEVTPVMDLADQLEVTGYPEVAAMVLLCRFLGLRSREAGLLRLSRAKREAEAKGVVNITRGTKGGRAAPRSVPITYYGMQATQRAWRIRSATGCLVAQSLNWKAFYQHAYYQHRKVAASHGLADGFHDYRAAYACDRYRELTGHVAPVVSRAGMPSREVDREARSQISTEMGHGREEVVASYIGSYR